jgi:hypothetical protein
MTLLSSRALALVLGGLTLALGARSTHASAWPSAVVDKLDQAGRDFADRLPRAGWTGPGSAGAVTITARNVALGSDAMLNALDNLESLTDEQQAAFRHVFQITLAEKGWLGGHELPADTYSVGMSRDDKARWLDVRDSAGEFRLRRSFWITSTTDAMPKTSAAQSGGGVVADLTIGGILFRFRFVASGLHDELTKGLQEHAAGRVRLFSDLTCAECLEGLAQRADRAVTAQSKFLGHKPPEATFDIYLFREEAPYVALDAAVTGGDFETNFGMSAHLTRKAYFVYRGVCEPDALGSDHEFPVKIRGTLLHELNHLLTAELYPDTYTSWPKWLREGLAEVATVESLSDGSSYRALMLAGHAHGRLYGAPTSLEDLLAGEEEPSREVYYGTAFRVVESLAKSSSKFRKLLATLEAAEPVTCRELARESATGLEAKLRRINKEKVPTEEPGVVLWGYLDTVDGNHRVVSHTDKPGMVILPGREKGPTLRIATAFAYHPVANAQADLYFAYAWEPERTEWLKLAVMPKHTVLFHYRGAWKELARTEHPAELAVGTRDELVWHEVVATFDSAKGHLRLERNGEPFIELETEVEVSVQDTRAGFGTFNGVVYFRPLDVSTVK